MLSKENIPKGFQILAKSSSLIIEYWNAITRSSTSSCLTSIFWIPFFLIFIYVYLLKKYLSPILNEFLQHIFGEYIQNLGIKNFEIDGLCSLIFWEMIGIFIYAVADASFSILEFQPLPEELVINRKLLETRLVQSRIP